MKYSAALGRLRTLAAELDRLAGFDDDFLLDEAWVFGEVLDGPDGLDVVSLALVVDLPAEEVTWCARPAPAEALASLLRLEKYPLRWFWRPTVWPVWNHAIARAVRFWSKGGGTDTVALEALADRRFDALTIVAPPDGEALRGQLLIDYEAARLHLRAVVDRYGDPGWRRDHKENGYFLRNDEGFLLALVPAEAHVALPPGFHIGFGLPSAEHVIEAHEGLNDFGARTGEVHDYRPGEAYVTFRCWDPDGTEIEIFWEPAA